MVGLAAVHITADTFNWRHAGRRARRFDAEEHLHDHLAANRGRVRSA